MKHYLEEREMLLLFFTAHFYYGRSKYGLREPEDIRLGRLAACKGVISISRLRLTEHAPVSRHRFAEDFARLERQAPLLADGPFKDAYLETLMTLRNILSSEE